MMNILTIEEALKATPGTRIPVIYMRLGRVDSGTAIYQIISSMLHVGNTENTTYIETQFDNVLCSKKVDTKFADPQPRYLGWPLEYATPERRAFAFPKMIWWVGELQDIELYQEATGNPNYWDEKHGNETIKTLKAIEES